MNDTGSPANGHTGDDDTGEVSRELREVALVLRECLARLDRVGAGIPAIHVNAAVEHLAALQGEAANDLAGAGGSLGRPFAAEIDARLLCILPATGRSH
ncbi:hypothetical protein [Erythrobacter sp.]|uniref:hypothetical protein n=1 Tax=Erythrobacter sp. TaxID=1042 RepID=UPI001425EBDD|nr:hypothetical protein [Erythrobacter sp.]QIQ86158.1 MAG: hypothetical protein G9473_05245 [Erythrobacter sp.]